MVQFAPVKSLGATPAQHDVRPVGCCGAGRRTIGRMVLAIKRPALRVQCEPVQLGQGTSAGTQAHVAVSKGVGGRRSTKDVNRLFHSDWALAFGEVLDQEHHALEDPDPLALERALKWALVCHQLLLRLDIAPSGTRRGQRYIATAP